MTLAGRVALVSGGGRGIGRAISLALAQDGAAVAINYRKDEAAAQEVADQVTAAGGKAKIYSASVENLEEDEAMVQAVLADFGKVDILINNAGIASRGNSVHDTDPAEMERVVRTHAFGSFYLSKFVLPSMRQQPRGDVIFISSVATMRMSGNGGPYNMGKAAMEALALTLYKEEQPYNIHVNIVAPGLVETQMGVRLAKATRGIQDIRELDKSMPFGHVCQPSDVSDVVRYLVSDRAGYLTGQKINVDGGASGY